MNDNRTIQLTEDGSHTLNIEGTNITYHSKYGAIHESKHVYIKSGLQYFIDSNQRQQNETINIFEMGFGTGLNALLSLQQAIELNQKIFYQSIETLPLLMHEVLTLNYTLLIDENLKKSFLKMHTSEWNKEVAIHPLFSFQKTKIDLHAFETTQQFHVIYFDAFDPSIQPELWGETIFKKMFDMLFTNGVLTTYCSKGIVRRAIQSAGFKTEKLAGPKGKREILRAVKI